jgi:ABC-type glycerol-3-phosphate transport system permease component
MAIKVPLRRTGPAAAAPGSYPPRGAVAVQNWRESLFRRAVTGVVIALALVWLVPVAWTLDTSIKPENSTILIPATWKVSSPTLSAYSAVFSATDLGRWYLNSAGLCRRRAGRRRA